MSFAGSILLLFFLTFSRSGELHSGTDPAAHSPSQRTERFRFQSGGEWMQGKVSLPEGYERHKNLPAIFLIDFEEQHFKLATDEFERLVDAVREKAGTEALVFSLNDIPAIDAKAADFRKHFRIYHDMAVYASEHYSDNPARTFVGKGSEGGLVLMALFLEEPEDALFERFVVTDPSPDYASAIIKIIETGDFPKNKKKKSLHFSFSTSNDRAKCVRLIEVINEAKFPFLRFSYFEFTRSDYEHSYPSAFRMGIEFVFNHD